MNTQIHQTDGVGNVATTVHLHAWITAVLIVSGNKQIEFVYDVHVA